MLKCLETILITQKKWKTQLASSLFCPRKGVVKKIKQSITFSCSTKKPINFSFEFAKYNWTNSKQLNYVTFGEVYVCYTNCNLKCCIKILDLTIAYPEFFGMQFEWSELKISEDK